MPTKDTRVDTYIANAKPFAQPILRKLRSLIFKACPKAVEKVRWGMPSYEYHGILCGIGAFKEYATFGFWKHALMEPIVAKELKHRDKAMGIMGKIRSLDDLPLDKVMLQLIKTAMKFNEEGVAAPKKPVAKTRRRLIIPDYFAQALKQNRAALSAFEAFSYSHKKEYIEWIASAKREETRARRISTALEWLAQGKPQSWKYMQKCGK